MKPDSLLENIFNRIKPAQKAALKKLGLKTVKDILYHFPSRYGSIAETKPIADVSAGEAVTIIGAISGLTTSKGFRTKIPMARARITDGTGSINAVWFNQPYIAPMLKETPMAKFHGKVSERKGELYLSNPEFQKVSGMPIDIGDSLFKENLIGEYHYPVYPETRGISSQWLYHAVKKIFETKCLDELKDPIPEDILTRYSLPSLKTALIWIHTPKKKEHAESARKRFAFEEIFFVQLLLQNARRSFAKEPAYIVRAKEKDIDGFVKRFPFPITRAQKRATEEIFKDLTAGHPMMRLLEGDVGSGKTAVAAASAYAIITTPPDGAPSARLEVAYMAPTEILARQHFETFIEFFKHTKISIGLITGNDCRKFPSKTNPNESTRISKSQLLKWVANGEIPIVVGTHALIQKTVSFNNLALIIIDEQHRFGVNQRAALVRGTNAEQTQNNADDQLIYRDLTYKIRRALFAVKSELGGGQKESVYQRAVAEELSKTKLSYKREVKIPILYNKKQVGIYQPDFVIEDKVVLELKALSFIGATEKKQLWTYLKGSEYKLGLLANFGPQELTIARVIYDTKRSASIPHSSASVPHLLSMSATPIPRTLALTIYGDLDLSLLDEMPVGRKQVTTEIVLPSRRKETYEFIRKEIASGRQCYVICPRIDEPDPDKKKALQVKSVKEEAARLKKNIFPEFEIGLLHGKMKPQEKESTMRAFSDGNINILVATSVVEVGVNIPNATIIIIEGADRFGLAQLHQLRGRVARSTHDTYCYVFTESTSKTTFERLRAFVSAKNGFELAELDLRLRGAGILSGEKQWGISDIGMEAIKNRKLVEAARNEVRALLSNEKTLSDYPLLAQSIANVKERHLE